jgi:hypothetical protein
MPAIVKGFDGSSLRLDEMTTRLAERLAMRFGVTPQYLIETLLLECAGRQTQAAALPASPRTKNPAPVIDFKKARRERSRRASNIL